MGVQTGQMPMQEPFRHWFGSKDQRWLLEYDWLGPRFCEVRATKGPAWWPLDTVILGTAANTPRGPGSSAEWHIIQTTHVDEIAACFAELGHAGRLEARRLPTREELES